MWGGGIGDTRWCFKVSPSGVFCSPFSSICLGGLAEIAEEFSFFCYLIWDALRLYWNGTAYLKLGILTALISRLQFISPHDLDLLWNSCIHICITQASIWMRMNSIHLRESRCNWLCWDEDGIHWCWTYDGWLCILGSSGEADANLQCREMAGGFWFNASLVCGHFWSRWNEKVKLWNRNKGASFAVDSFNQVQTCQLSALQL